MRHGCASAKNVHPAQSLNSGRGSSPSPLPEANNNQNLPHPDQTQWRWLQNPVHLIGSTNEAEILIDDIPVTALIDTRAQVSTISQDICLSHGYDMLLVTQMLRLEGTWGFRIHWGLHKNMLNQSVWWMCVPPYSEGNTLQCLGAYPNRHHLHWQGNAEDHQ